MADVTEMNKQNQLRDKSLAATNTTEAEREFEKGGLFTLAD
jgi:hypothetical protein